MWIPIWRPKSEEPSVMPASKARLNQPLELIQPLAVTCDDPEEVERRR